MSVSRREFLQVAGILGGAVAAGWFVVRKLLAPDGELGGGQARASPPKSLSTPWLASSTGSGTQTPADRAAAPRRVGDDAVSEATPPGKGPHEALHYEKLSGNSVRCRLCCRRPGKRQGLMVVGGRA